MPPGIRKPNYARMQRDQQRIADESPATESKAQLKERLYQRQRVTMGDEKPARQRNR